MREGRVGPTVRVGGSRPKGYTEHVRNGEWAVSCERGTPVLQRQASDSPSGKRESERERETDRQRERARDRVIERARDL